MLFSGVCDVFSQETSGQSVTHFTVKNGLASGKVHKITQDSQGFIWIATENGLTRYDGYSFKNYGQDEDGGYGITHNFVNEVVPQNKRGIWVGTISGLDKYDPIKGEFKHYYLYDEYNEKYFETVDQIIPLTNGSCFLRTHEDISLYSHELDSIIRVDEKNYRPQANPKVMVRTDAVTVMVGDESGALYTVDILGEAKLQNKLANGIVAIKQIQPNKYLIADNTGSLYLYEKGEFTRRFIFPISNVSNSQRQISSIEKLTDSTFLIGTKGLGIFGFSLKKGWNPNLIPRTSLINNHIANIFVDREKNIWISHMFGGISLWTQQSIQIKYFNCPQAIQKEKVQALETENDSILWIGTEGNGLYEYNTHTNSYNIYNAETKLFGQPFDNVITSLHINRHILWVSTYNKGVYGIDLNTKKVLYHDALDILPTEKITSVFVDTRNRLWVGTYEFGVFVFDIETSSVIKNYNQTSTDSINQISCDGVTGFYEDNQGDMWLTTYYGLSKIGKNGDVARYVYSHNPGLGNNVITSVFQDSPDSLWLGTLQGLSALRLAEDTIVKIETKYGNFSHVISEIFNYDSTFNLIVSPQVVYSYNKKTNNFGFVGTCPSGEFNRSTYTKFGDKVLLGTEKGIVEVKIDTNFVDEGIHTIELTDMLVHGISVFAEDSPYKAYVEDSLFSITLPHIEDNVTFFFTDFLYGKQIGEEYVYRLEGLQKEWIPLIGHNFVSYTNLSGGDYSFVVKKATANGLSTNSMVVKLHIERAFWESWLFYMFLLVIVSIVLYMVYNARVNKIVLTRNRLQKQVELRMQDIQKKTTEIQLQKEKILEQRDIANKQSAEFSRQKDELIAKHNLFEEKVREKQKELYDSVAEANELRGVNEVLGEQLDVVNQFSQEMFFKVNLPSEEYVFVSPACFAITGFKPEDFYADKHLYRTLISSEDKDSYKKFRKYMVEGKTPPYTEYKIVTSDGQTKWLAQYSRHLRDENQVPYAFEGMIIDVTELKKIERKQNAAQIRSDFSNQVLEKSTSDCSEQQFHSRETLRLFTELLNKPDISLNEKQAMLDSTNGNSSILQMISDIIDISKIEAGEMQLNNSQCYVNSLFKELHESFTEIKNKNKKRHLGLDLLIPIEEQNFSFYTDTYRLRQIMMNLIGNAFKYTSRGRIVFGYELIDTPNVKTDKEIVFFVKDTGKGVNKDLLPVIFERFSDTGDKLHGIGLSLSQQLVSLLGGRIWVESEEGKGTKFYFALPIRKMKGLKKTDATKSTTVLKDWSKKTLLLAEDEESNYDLVRESLKKTNITILWEKDGESAVKRFEEQQRDIDVILMDIQMPKMNGYEATQLIKAIDKDIPIIAQTAYANSEAKLNCFDAGCDNYLAKPYKSRDLMDMLSKYL